MVGQRGVVATDSSARVTPLEIFFDLVFVYALTQVTALLATDISAIGFARGLVVLALVWWCWVGYSWLGNQAQADEGIVRVAFIVVMMAMFVLALTIPETWGDLPGGLEAPVVFALCYLVIRVAHLGLYWIAAAGDTPGCAGRFVCSRRRRSARRPSCSQAPRGQSSGACRCGPSHSPWTSAARSPSAPRAGGSMPQGTSPSATG